MNLGASKYLQTTATTTLYGTVELFAFTGKELDAETGYSYFGARYYDPATLTAWLSVDPMSDKYPSISPYAYCAWNPLKLVDPNGMDTAFAGAQERQLYLEYRNIVFSDDKYANIQKELENIENSDEIFCIRLGNNVSSEDGGGNFKYNSETGQFDVNIKNNTDWTDIEVISHELKHADQYLNKKLGFLFITKTRFILMGYSIDDEIEAYDRQGLFGNTLNHDQVHNKYKDKGYYGENGTINNTNEWNKRNELAISKWGHPIYLYHGWNNIQK